MKTNEVLKLITDKEFLDKIYRFSYRRCNTSSEAEDLCSDIILAVLSAVHRQVNIDNFYALVWTIARRIYADYSEKRSITRQIESIENEDLLLVAKENEIDDLIDSIAEKEMISKVLAEIAFLSKIYREVMILYYIEGMKVKDIAVKLGVNETTIKQRLFSARNIVREGVETMTERHLTLKPKTMDFFGSGSVSGNDPFANAKRAFSQNLIYACKETAKTAKELSDELCAPSLYIEEELEMQLKGLNGTYGTLRKQGDKYISNVIIVDEKDCDEGAKLYKKYTEKFCDILKGYLEENEQKFCEYPFISKPKSIKDVLWVLINSAAWGFVRETENIVESKYFAEVHEAIKTTGRKYTFGAVARDMNTPKIARGYGCDSNTAKNFCGFSSVEFRNIYGPKVCPHFRVGYNLSQDERIALLLKSIGGILVESLSDGQKELAAKGIEEGLLRKNDNVLEPAVLIIEKSKVQGLYKLLDDFYTLLSPCCEELAAEVAKHIKKHIQKHLIDEYKTYNMLISSAFIGDVIDMCITKGLLNVPKSGKGSEGVLVLVEK